MCEDEHGAYGHSYVGGYGRTADAHVEAEDEQRVEGDVDGGSYHHCHHGTCGIARCAHYVVEAESEVGHEQAGKESRHEVAGVGQRGVAGAEQSQHGVEECVEHSHVACGEHDEHCQGIAQSVLGFGMPSFAEEYRHARRRSGAYEHS